MPADVLFLDATDQSGAEIEIIKKLKLSVIQCRSVAAAEQNLHSALVTVVAKLGTQKDKSDSGFELLRRAKTKYPALNVVIYSYSAIRKPEIKALCLAHGAALVSADFEKEVIPQIKAWLDQTPPAASKVRRNKGELLWLDSTTGSKAEQEKIIKMGFEITWCQSTAEGIQIFNERQQQLHAIVAKLGVQQDGSDSGLRLVAHAKATNPAVNRVIFSWTACARKETYDHCVAEGAELISKDIDEIAVFLAGLDTMTLSDEPTDLAARETASASESEEEVDGLPEQGVNRVQSIDCNVLSRQHQWRFISGNIGEEAVVVYTDEELAHIRAHFQKYRRVRIVVISDTHCFHEHLQMPPGDILVCCGDFANRCPGTDQLITFNSWLGTLPYEHKVIIAGNQEYYLNQLTREDSQAKIFTNATYLQDSGCNIHGIKFYGTPWNGSSHMAFSADRETRQKMYEKIPECDVLITHMPPKGILDLAGNQANWGDANLRDVVFRRKPRVHLFGHVHEMYGYERHDTTTFINCALKWNAMRRPVEFDLFVEQ
eukprot:TRINITY_DN14835_c0_g1_i1.p1 TRINITY_DN14835_c0_g1~~TRINITY_DN14835_c0_g1_i1.p1  ORF type:complete len:543 (-),score=76.17 TRINITY_DN14835_c0_g1_i1:6-1634(-)